MLLAKATVVAASLFVGSLAASSVAWAIGWIGLSGEGYAAGRPLPALLGVAALFAAVGVLGLVVGTLLRHGAGSIVSVLGLLLVPSMLAPLFGDLQRWVHGSASVAAMAKLVQSSDATATAAGSLGAWPSVALMWVFVAALLALASTVLETRDA